MRQNSISRSHSEAPAHAGRVLQGGGRVRRADGVDPRSEEHTSELQSQSNLVCRLLLEKKNKITAAIIMPDSSDCSHHRPHCSTPWLVPMGLWSHLSRARRDTYLPKPYVDDVVHELAVQ